jgi:hypothetical protein
MLHQARIPPFFSRTGSSISRKGVNEKIGYMRVHRRHKNGVASTSSNPTSSGRGPSPCGSEQTPPVGSGVAVGVTGSGVAVAASTVAGGIAVAVAVGLTVAVAVDGASVSVGVTGGCVGAWVGVAVGGTGV